MSKHNYNNEEAFFLDIASDTLWQPLSFILLPCLQVFVANFFSGHKRLPVPVAWQFSLQFQSLRALFYVQDNIILQPEIVAEIDLLELLD